MKNSLVFDLDGTLVDTAPDLMSAHNHVMKKYGYEEKPLESIRHLAGRGAAAMLIKSIDAQGNLIKNNPIDQNTHQQMTKDFIAYYRKNISGHSTIRKNVISLFDALTRSLISIIKPLSKSLKLFSLRSFKRLIILKGP